MGLLGSIIVFLGATLIAVPIFKRFRLGAILGYLVAGVIIGPSALNLISDAGTILHFAELGVVLLLFLIGLELEPPVLWRMRNQILLSGGGQLFITAALITLIVNLVFGLSWPVSIAIGLALGLSSTAFAIQLMNEQRILRTPPGQQGFSILLMQDVAVIPILLLVQFLSPQQAADGPPWWVGILAIVGVLVVGQFLINPFLRIVSRYGSAEVMTAAALFIVLMTAVSMEHAGMSMGMGAFIAGILLAESSFKHQLETEVEPFKGLLLGLFFIAIGMNLDLNLLVSEPMFIIACAIALVALKLAVIFVIMRLTGNKNTDAIRVGLMLSQGGEFAFVVMTQALASSLIGADDASRVNLIVGISMALTSPLVILHSLWFSSRNCPPVYDTHSEVNEPEVIIAGFGRFGQITGRLLTANHIPFTALDKDAEHIAFVSRFGNKVFYGDACRLDLLKIAGIEHAKIVLIAIDTESEIDKLVHLVKGNYPSIRVVARAHNRLHAQRLAKMGVETFVRETFDSALVAASSVLREYGFSAAESESMIQIFANHDRQRLQQSIDEDLDMPAMIASSQQGRMELQRLFREDREDLG